jgi:hypothetical protein
MQNPAEDGSSPSFDTEPGEAFSCAISRIPLLFFVAIVLAFT